MMFGYVTKTKGSLRWQQTKVWYTKPFPKSPKLPSLSAFISQTHHGKSINQAPIIMVILFLITSSSSSSFTSHTLSSRYSPSSYLTIILPSISLLMAISPKTLPTPLTYSTKYISCIFNNASIFSWDICRVVHYSILSG